MGKTAITLAASRGVTASAVTRHRSEENGTGTERERTTAMTIPCIALYAAEAKGNKVIAFKDYKRCRLSSTTTTSRMCGRKGIRDQTSLQSLQLDGIAMFWRFRRCCTSS